MKLLETWCHLSGALSVDEAVSLASSVSSGNQRTLCWFMLPQWHSSTGKCTVLKNRRLLEDKVVGILDRKNCKGLKEHTYTEYTMFSFPDQER